MDSGSRRLRVFVVEDTRTMLASLESLFTADQGFEIVGSASTSAYATQWLMENEGAWDVVSVDLILDDGAGFGLIRRAKNLPRAGHVVVFSEYVTEVIREQCRYFGADAVFTKTQIREYAEYMHALKRSLLGVA